MEIYILTTIIESLLDLFVKKSILLMELVLFCDFQTGVVNESNSRG